MIGLMITAVELVVVFAYTTLVVTARVAVGLVKLIFLLVAAIVGRSRPKTSEQPEPLER